MTGASDDRVIDSGQAALWLGARRSEIDPAPDASFAWLHFNLAHTDALPWLAEHAALMDLESRRRWEDYTRAKEIMLARTHIAEAPWWVVQAIDKKRARLNCIHHLLSQMPYENIEHEAIVLPERERRQDYIRHPVPSEIMVPEVF